MISCKDEQKQNTSSSQYTPVKFITPFNQTKLQRGKTLKIEIEISPEISVSHLKIFNKNEVIYDDQPKEQKLSINANTLDWSVGSNQISLEAKMSDGSVKTDKRIIKLTSNIIPTDYVAEVVNVYPHSTSNYTQGLEFYNNRLFEGTGGMGKTGGKSKLMEIDLKTGKSIQSLALNDNLFGEGITILNDKIYQLTWQQNKCFVYDVNTFELLNTFEYTGEGWGLTNNGKHLIMSDGTERLYFRDPENFQLLKTIEVYNNLGAQKLLNELEYINGKILANIYTTNNIVKINIENGIVEGIIDASLIALDYKGNGEVLNGIAYKASTKQLFITGKNWPNLLEIELKEL